MKGAVLQPPHALTAVEHFLSNMALSRRISAGILDENARYDCRTLAICNQAFLKFSGE
jgi:hypothetical protein